MATHWFSTSDIEKLLANKKVVVIGDSVQRSVYKDLLCLLEANQLLKIEDLKKKGEDSFKGDKLLEGGSKAGLKTTEYKEERKFTKGSTVILFYFVTRCYGEYMKSIIKNFETEPPDLIIMNSCLWDICRYGNNANVQFKTNVSELLEEIGLVMPYDSERMFIWNATLPVLDTSSKTSCVPHDFPQAFGPENQTVRNANLYVREQMVDYGDHFIFLDLYQIFHNHRNHRIHDGVHWDDFAHRKITCLLLTEVSEQWDFKLPAKENDPPFRPRDSRRTIRTSLSSIPSVGGRRSLGFVPNHSRSPYQRPSPRPFNHGYHSQHRPANPLPSPFFAWSRPQTPRQSNFGPRQSTPGQRQSLQSPYRLENPLASPFSASPFSAGSFSASPRGFGIRPHWRPNPMNFYNGVLSSPSVNWLLNSTFPPTGRRIWEEDVYSVPSNGYKPRKFL